MSDTKKTGLHFSRHFTKEGISPFDIFEYDYRTSVIKNTTGEVVFQMDNVEVPKQWSQIATDILAQKYFRKAGVPQADGTTGRETSVKQVAHRMAHCWRVWGERKSGVVNHMKIVDTVTATAKVSTSARSALTTVTSV